MKSQSFTIMIRPFVLTLLSFLILTAAAIAQDTTKRKTIDITSTFKPVLREASKINFSAAPPAVDSGRPKLSYNIPERFLFLSYMPAELKPVALQMDSVNPWNNDNYIKLGFGNVHQPYAKAGFSFGDGQTKFFNVYAEQFTSKGSLAFQKSSLSSVGLTGTVKTKNNLEWNGRLGFKNDGYYLYGYQPDTFKFRKSDLQQNFQTYEGRLALRNTVPTEFGLTYNPNILVSVFTDNHSPQATEANTVLNLPLEKSLGQDFTFDLGLTADLTNYKIQHGITRQNNLYYVSPALKFHVDNIKIKAEITPSWDQKAFHLLPNFTADVSTNDQRFTFFAGWIGRYEKGSYERFESINPWLDQPDSLLNTRIQEGFGGFKGSLNNHISYLAKIGFVNYHNMPLFVNDASIGNKSFEILYANSMDALQVHGEITYTIGETFSATAALDLKNFSDIKSQAKAWGLIPRQFTADLRWAILKDLWLKADLLAFDGIYYRDPNGSAHTSNRAVDLNAGVEFRIARQLNLWLQMNNIFNNNYERWHQYQVYGFNILGGVVFSFGQKNK